jgi:hypothetical protein
MRSYATGEAGGKHVHRPARDPSGGPRLALDPASVHKGQSHPGEHTPIIDRPLWDAVQAQLAANTAERNSGTRTRQPSLLAGMLFDGDGTRMTPTHAIKRGTRHRYYVSQTLITSGQTKFPVALLHAARPPVPSIAAPTWFGRSSFACGSNFLLPPARCERKDLIIEVGRATAASDGSVTVIGLPAFCRVTTGS